MRGERRLVHGPFRGGRPAVQRARAASGGLTATASRERISTERTGSASSALRTTNTPLRRCTVAPSWNERAQRSTGLQPGPGLRQAECSIIRAGTGRAASRPARGGRSEMAFSPLRRLTSNRDPVGSCSDDEARHIAALELVEAPKAQDRRALHPRQSAQHEAGCGVIEDRRRRAGRAGGAGRRDRRRPGPRGTRA